MIEAKGVSLRYPDSTLALKDIDFKISPGELVYITGPSGSGKTSLLKLIMGMEHPTSGNLEVLGQNISSGKSGRVRKVRKNIGPVFQEFKLIEGRSAIENVCIGMRFLGISPRQMKKQAVNVLERVGLGHKETSLVENLSWGEAQRVAIARAVVREPKLLLADEPTGNLDMENALNILKLLKTFQTAKTAVIITTHATHLIENNEKATFVRVDNGSISIERRY